MLLLAHRCKRHGKRERHNRVARTCGFIVLFFVFGALLTCFNKAIPWALKPMFLQKANLLIGQIPELPKADNPHDFSYVIKPRKDPCQKLGHGRLFVGVPSAPKNRAERDAIRNSWGSETQRSRHEMVVLFFVATPTTATISGTTVAGKEGGVRLEVDQKVQYDLKMEAQLHDDIVQEDFVDAYMNLTLKSVAILKWAVNRCGDFDFVGKIDDDVYIHISRLLAAMDDTRKSLEDFVLGHVVTPTARSVVAPQSPYYYQYPYHFYPPYIGGPSYVITAQAVGLMFEASKRLKVIEAEDVYITGFCAREAGVPMVDTLAVDGDPWEYEECESQDRIAGHGHLPHELQAIHKSINHRDTKCEEVSHGWGVLAFVFVFCPIILLGAVFAVLRTDTCRERFNRFRRTHNISALIT